MSANGGNDLPVAKRTDNQAMSRSAPPAWEPQLHIIGGLELIRADLAEVSAGRNGSNDNWEGYVVFRFIAKERQPKPI